MSCCFRYTARTERFMEDELRHDRSPGSDIGNGLRWLVVGVLVLLAVGLVLGAAGI